MKAYISQVSCKPGLGAIVRPLHEMDNAVALDDIVQYWEQPPAGGVFGTIFQKEDGFAYRSRPDNYVNDNLLDDGQTRPLSSGDVIWAKIKGGEKEFTFLDSKGLDAAWWQFNQRRGMAGAYEDWWVNQKLTVTDKANTDAGWAVYVYADSEADLFNVGSAVFATLKNRYRENPSFVYKTPGSLEDLKSWDTQPWLRGKGFVAYIALNEFPHYRELIRRFDECGNSQAAATVEDFIVERAREEARTLANLLDKRLVEAGLGRTGMTLPGARPVPDTESGRLFYAYIRNEPIHVFDKSYRDPEARTSHNIPDNPDIFG
ncbi:MAG: hypothetical protein ABH879_10240 [archaeon]